MEEILANLCETSGITGSLLVGKDGIVISSRLNGGEDADSFGASVADLFGGIVNTADNYASGVIEMLSVERIDGKLFLQNLEEANALLAVLAGPKVNLGLVRLEMKEAAHKFKELLM